MPTFFAGGVYARLHVDGHELFERLLGPLNDEDVKRPNVLQFIGQYQDKPTFMVLASAERARLHKTTTNVEDEDGQEPDQELSPPSPPLGMESASSLSSLTSLLTSISALTEPGNMPSPAQERPLIQQKPDLIARPFRNVSHVLLNPPDRHGEHALTLTINLSKKTFLPTKPGRPRSGQDLKVEMFMNGRLVECAYISRKTPQYKLAYTGTRVERQQELPWTYDCRDVSSDSRNNDIQGQQWKAVNQALASEVTMRGKDKWGESTPVGDYLDALSKLALPLEPPSLISDGFSKFGVFDVVISAGEGRKLGPETGHIKEPTRMPDDRYSLMPASGNPILPEPAHIPSEISAPSRLSESVCGQQQHHIANDVEILDNNTAEDSPISSLPSTPQRRPLSDADAAFALAQRRTDLAVESGASPGGRLIEKIASSSPVRPIIKDKGKDFHSSPIKSKPQSRTTASALTNSPITLAPKNRSGRGGRRVATAPAPEATVLAAPVSTSASNTHAHDVSAAQTSTSRMKRRRTDEPANTLHDETVQVFKDEPSQPCVIGHSASGRNVSQARAGWFKEEEVICGMRFVVL